VGRRIPSNVRGSSQKSGRDDVLLLSVRRFGGCSRRVGGGGGFRGGDGNGGEGFSEAVVGGRWGLERSWNEVEVSLFV